MKKIFTTPAPVKNTFSTNEKGISSDSEQSEPQKMRRKSKSNERAKQRWKLLRNTLLAIRIRCNRNLKDIAAENHYDEVRANGERRLSFLGQQYPLKRLSTSSRTLSMDTHYPESVEDFNDLEDEEDEEHVRVQQELAEQAMKIEREFWNIDFNC